MVLKQDILDYINNNYSDCLLNISLFDIIAMIGKEEAIKRLENAIEKL